MVNDLPEVMLLFFADIPKLSFVAKDITTYNMLLNNKNYVFKWSYVYRLYSNIFITVGRWGSKVFK